MTKIAKEIHKMIDTCLFCPEPWPDDTETNLALSRKLDQMGFQKQVAGRPEGTRTATALGKEYHLDMLMVFIGLWNTDDMPMILENHGMIDEKECTRIYNQFEAHSDIKPDLLSIVRQAYFDFYGSSQTMN